MIDESRNSANTKVKVGGEEGSVTRVGASFLLYPNGLTRVIDKIIRLSIGIEMSRHNVPSEGTL